MTIAERDRSGGAADAARSAPAIVMVHTRCGADRLGSVPAAFPELAWTQPTGILAVRDHAITAWQISGHGFSPLAASSVKARCPTPATARLGRKGRAEHEQDWSGAERRLPRRAR